MLGSVTSWAVALQALLSLGFSWQEYRSRLPFLPPRDLLDTGIKPGSPASPALAGRFFITELPGKLVVVCKIGEIPPHLAAVWRWSRYLNSAWNTPDKKSTHPSRVTRRALNTLQIFGRCLSTDLESSHGSAWRPR